MDDFLPARPRKGRGAIANPAGRFERFQADAIDDGWWQDEDLPPLKTSLGIDTARSVISNNDSPDIPFDQSINPYRGCEHGCVYCFARPTHAYLGLSPGLDFETRLFCKPDAAKLLEKELAHPRYVCRPIAIGTNTDPYQPVEKQAGVMRAILEALAACRHPVTITTKSALIVRDLDILAEMAAQNLVEVGISLTSLDGDLARKLEPRASAPPLRLRAMAQLTQKGIPVSVMAAPIIPGLTDWEIERILTAAADFGAVGAGWQLLRLPREVAPLFLEWLAHHAPLKAAKVESLLRQTRQGALYRSGFGERMRGEGPISEMITARIKAAAARLGLGMRNREGLDCSQFRPPILAKPGRDEKSDAQLSLFSLNLFLSPLPKGR